MIVFSDVTKKYGDNIGLNKASVHIKNGDFVFLVGPSGAGKTTFIRLILKELEPDGGKITIAGKDVTHLHRREIPALRQKIGMVFQDFRLLEQKTVYENVAFAMEVVHKSKKEIRERVPEVLKLVGIEDKQDRYPDELSAGEQQRVGIARALVNKPRVLICDEPTGNLDPATAMDIMKLLEQINVRGTTILMVTHARDIVNKMNKRVVAIENGRIVRDETGGYGYMRSAFDTEVKGEIHDDRLRYEGEKYSVPSYGYGGGDYVDESVFGNSLANEDSAFGIMPQDFEKSKEDGKKDTLSNILSAYLDDEEA